LSFRAKLTQAAQFQAVLKHGARRASSNFGAQALLQSPNGQRGPRLGLIASRKASHRAVDRNRGKRLTRDVFRARMETWPPIDIVVQLKNNLRGGKNAALREELARLLDDIVLRCSTQAGKTAR